MRIDIFAVALLALLGGKAALADDGALSFTEHCAWTDAGCALVERDEGPAAPGVQTRYVSTWIQAESDGKKKSLEVTIAADKGEVVCQAGWTEYNQKRSSTKLSILPDEASVLVEVRRHGRIRGTLWALLIPRDSDADFTRKNCSDVEAPSHWCSCTSRANAQVIYKGCLPAAVACSCDSGYTARAAIDALCN